MLKKKQAEFQPDGDITRVVSLGGGTYAYVFDHLGKTHRVKRDSEEMIALCRTIDENTNKKATLALTKLGWDDVLEAMSDD